MGPDGDLAFYDVYFMGHANPDRGTKYFQITTAAGRVLRLTDG